MSDYELGWCHMCACAIVSCTVPDCHATTCNSGRCTHQDLDAIAKELKIDEIPFKDYEHQSFDHIEGLPLMQLAEWFAKATQQGYYHEDRTYTHACSIITLICIQLMKDGKAVWHWKDALGQCCTADKKFVHMLDFCIPEHMDSRATHHLDADGVEIDGKECPNCKQDRDILAQIDAEKKRFPISKYSGETGWILVQEVKGTYDNALAIAEDLQNKDHGFQYRVWENK